MILRAVISRCFHYLLSLICIDYVCLSIRPIKDDSLENGSCDEVCGVPVVKDLNPDIQSCTYLYPSSQADSTPSVLADETPPRPLELIIDFPITQNKITFSCSGYSSDNVVVSTPQDESGFVEAHSRCRGIRNCTVSRQHVFSMDENHNLSNNDHEISEPDSYSASAQSQSTMSDGVLFDHQGEQNVSNSLEHDIIASTVKCCDPLPETCEIISVSMAQGKIIGTEVGSGLRSQRKRPFDKQCRSQQFSEPHTYLTGDMLHLFVHDDDASQARLSIEHSVLECKKSKCSLLYAEAGASKHTDREIKGKDTADDKSVCDVLRDSHQPKMLSCSRPIMSLAGLEEDTVSFTASLPSTNASPPGFWDMKMDAHHSACCIAASECRSHVGGISSLGSGVPVLQTARQSETVGAMCSQGLDSQTPIAVCSPCEKLVLHGNQFSRLCREHILLGETSATASSAVSSTDLELTFPTPVRQQIVDSHLHHLVNDAIVDTSCLVINCILRYSGFCAVIEVI